MQLLESNRLPQRKRVQTKWNPPIYKDKEERLSGTCSEWIDHNDSSLSVLLPHWKE